MDLDKSQLDFIVALSKVKEIHRDFIPNSQLKMIDFLENNKLINVRREIIRSYLESETKSVCHVYGDIVSVSISETGKAYLASKKNELKSTLLKDVYIPIIVTVITNLLMSGIKLLLPLIQGLLTNTPK